MEILFKSEFFFRLFAIWSDEISLNGKAEKKKKKKKKSDNINLKSDTETLNLGENVTVNFMSIQFFTHKCTVTRHKSRQHLVGLEGLHTLIDGKSIEKNNVFVEIRIGSNKTRIRFDTYACRNDIDTSNL